MMLDKMGIPLEGYRVCPLWQLLKRQLGPAHGLCGCGGEKVPRRALSSDSGREGKNDEGRGARTLRDKSAKGYRKNSR